MPTPTLSPKPAPTATPTPTATPFPGQEGVSIDLHMDRTVGTVGEDIPATLSIVNSIAKPEMTVRLILRVPSGMSLSGAQFAEACAGQCVAIYKVQPGQLRNINLNLHPNQAGLFNVTGDIEWFFGEDTDQVFRKAVQLGVTAEAPSETPVLEAEQQAEVEEEQVTSSEGSGTGGGLSGLQILLTVFGGIAAIVAVGIGLQRVFLMRQ